MSPIILAFNIRHSVYQHFGLSLFHHAKSKFKMHLLPIVTNPDEGIEERALKIKNQFQKLMTRLRIEKAHIACYSTCGVDFRFAISQLGIAPHCKSLTTISSPHQGSKLALLSDRKVFKPDVIDPISRLTGVGLRPFHEFTPENMKNFNSFVEDDEGVQYFSMGSERSPNICPFSLRDTGKYLQNKTIPNMVYHNDGVFGHDETIWGEYLTNFEADHGEVIGVFGKKDCPALHTVKEIVADLEGKEAENSGNI